MKSIIFVCNILPHSVRTIKFQKVVKPISAIPANNNFSRRIYVYVYVNEIVKNLKWKIPSKENYF